MRKYIFLGLGLLVLSMPLAAGAVSIESPIASKTIYDFLNIIIDICLKIVLPLATIIILVAAFFIVRGGGDSTKLDKGKKMLLAGLGGLAIVILGAGSGALLKNIFVIPSLESSISMSAPVIDGFVVSSMKDVEDFSLNLKIEIAVLENELEAAVANGNETEIKRLREEINSKKSQLDSVIAYGEKIKGYLLSDNTTFVSNIYNEAYGDLFLSKYGIKDANGFYKMEGGGKYNPETGEYIDVSGKSYTNTTINAAGAVFCNCSI